MQFPDDWPESCPPSDAEDVSGVYYAAARSNPYSEEDFTSAFERDVFKNADACERRGVSVTATRADSEALLVRFQRIYKYVASATLTEDQGKIKETPRANALSHCTFWPYLEVNLKQVFEVIT